MSAPNLDKPNEGIIGQISNSVSNAANYVTETIQGNASEVSKEANKQQMKGNAGDTSLTGRVSGGLDAASDKLNQKKHETAASANKEAI
jgi:Glucose-repressible protein Grg1